MRWFGCLAAGFAVVVASTLLSASEPWTSAASTAPDTRIVFIGRDLAALWSMRGDGTDLVQITRPPKGSYDGWAVWSADKSRIAFIRYVVLGQDDKGDYGRDDLMIVNANGSSIRRLMTHVMGPSTSWSPDGTRIAFTRYDKSDAWIWTVKADGTRPRKLARGSDPTWSPSGREIAFHRYETASDREELFVMSASGSAQRRLVPAFRGSTSAGVAWSPSGKRIAFNGAPGPLDLDYSLYVVTRNGTGVRKVAGGLSGSRTPEWSPDGSKLLIERGQQTAEGTFLVTLADGALRRVATDALDWEWSPDGRRIAFVTAYDLYVVNAIGGSPRRIARGVRSIDW